MRDTVLIFAGTAAGAVGLEFERKRIEEVERLTLRFPTSVNGQHAALARRLEDVRGGIQVLAIDVDTTNVYQLNTPLNDTVPTWRTGTFLPCQLPGPDMVRRIREGQHRGRFEYLNSEAVIALEGHGEASGGVRTNGWLAVETNRARIHQEIRRRFEAIITRRRVLASPSSGKVRVILVDGTFGGFGSGSNDWLRRFIPEIACEMRIDIDLSSIVLVPGTNVPKDPDSTFALTHAVLRELAAQSTGLHWHRRKRTSGNRVEMSKSLFMPTVIMSDTNHAPGEPKALSVENFHGMVAELLRAHCLTDIGPRIDALAADFQTLSLQLTSAGEPRFGRSAGIALVHLDRDRLFQFARAKMTDLLLSSSLDHADAQALQRDVRAFFEARRLVQGARVQQLSDRLLERGDGRRGLVDADRFHRLYHNNTAELTGMALLTEAPRRLQLSLQQSGNLETALTGRGDDLIVSLAADVRKRTDELARDRRTGCGGARQWNNEIILVTENMLAEAAKDTAIFEQRVAELQRRATHFENVYVPQLRRKNAIYRWRRRRLIDANAAEYARCLEEQELARMRLAAHVQAMRVLTGLLDTLRQRFTEVQTAVDTVTAEREAARSEVERITRHRPDYDCPVGLPLIDGPEDLQRLYARLLPEGGEEQVLDDVHARLLQVNEILGVASAPALFHEQVMRAVETSFRVQISDLHVVDELRRRFPGAEELGAALRERVRESHEWIQLRDNCDLENGVFLVRLLGIDANRAGDIPKLLAQYDYQRGGAFQVVSMDDPERIYFVQFRGVFPYSDWAHFPHSRAVYERVSEEIPFEKLHVGPGERSLPVPGDVLVDVAVQVVLVKAWLLGRLQYDEHDAMFLLISSDEMPQPLGEQLEALSGVEGYRRTVDVSSHYWCRYLARGPDPIVERLAYFRSLSSDHGAAGASLERHLVALVSEEACNWIEGELKWWRKNSVPSAMEWGGASGSNGSARQLGLVRRDVEFER